jgi:hypothetical protein
VCVGDDSYRSSSQQRSKEEDIQALLKFEHRPHESSEFPHYRLYSPLLDLTASRSCIRALNLLSRTLVVAGVHTILVRLLHSLQSHLGDCDGESLRDHTHAYKTQPIAIISYSDGDRFCLAAPIAVSWATRRPQLAGESACRMSLGLHLQHGQQPLSET